MRGTKLLLGAPVARGLGDTHKCHPGPAGVVEWVALVKQEMNRQEGEHVWLYVDNDETKGRVLLMY